MLDQPYFPGESVHAVEFSLPVRYERNTFIGAVTVTITPPTLVATELFGSELVPAACEDAPDIYRGRYAYQPPMHLLSVEFGEHLTHEMQNRLIGYVRTAWRTAVPTM